MFRRGSPTYRPRRTLHGMVRKRSASTARTGRSAVSVARRRRPEEMRWFLTQEIAGEAGFDDLVALTQVRLPVRPKLEMAANYWDEMGRGHEKGMHGGMLEHTAEELELTPNVRSTVWESLALANLMAGLATNRRYTYQSVGALGAIEMTAPGRVSLVNDGLRRLGVSARGRQYFQLHAGLDVRHSEAWNREVIRPLVASDPRIARAIAEGALMRFARASDASRLSPGARCFQRSSSCPASIEIAERRAASARSVRFSRRRCRCDSACSDDDVADAPIRRVAARRRYPAPVPVDDHDVADRPAVTSPRLASATSPKWRCLRSAAPAARGSRSARPSTARHSRIRRETAAP